jgi:hypothetical protein
MNPLTAYPSVPRPDVGRVPPPSSAFDWLRVASIVATRPGRANQSEAPADGRDGMLIYSSTGQKLRAAILCGCGGTAAPATALMPQRGVDSRGHVIREQNPLVRLPYGQHNGYTNFIGALAVRAARTVPVIQAYRYAGQLPLDQQPKIRKPAPWLDPTLGRP